MTAALTEPKLAARQMNNYARRYSAGAFATPTAREIEDLQRQGLWNEWDDGRVLAAERILTRDSKRVDFTGRTYVLPKGSRILTHLTSETGGRLPDVFGGWDFIYTYREDFALSEQLLQHGWRITAMRVSAASELIACWEPGAPPHVYPPYDRATFRQIAYRPQLAGLDVFDRILNELATIDEWHDDFPYYSDGSWDAVSLRGFAPDDPTWGIKPSEMPRKWKEEHPEALDMLCQWTTLAKRVPSIVELIESVPWWKNLERVRLLRMNATEKGGHLSRHSDITDKFAGTRDGLISRFHVPLVTHPDVTMTTWNLDGKPVEKHMTQWSCWYLDARKPHAVANLSPVNRIHLVVDVLADEEVRDRITQGREAW